jgi:hypothetical protein
MSNYNVNGFYTSWIASATGAYRDHLLFGQMVRTSIVACGGDVMPPRLTLAEGARQ